MVTGCDKFGMGGDGSSGPGMSESSAGGGTTGGGTGGTGTSGLSGTGQLPSSTSGFGTEGCGTDETAADPWGDEDGCGGGLPTSSPWDVGNGGNCWGQTDRWNESCEEEPCLDYDCHSPSPCGPVTFGECSGGGGGGGGGGTSGGTDGGEATTGGPELEVDDPAALECILEALRDHVPIRFTINDCESPSELSTTYEVVANGLVITTTSEAYGDNHFREQRISTFNEGYDFDDCVGAGVSNYEKRFCVGLADGGPCPVGPVACPEE
ncbi:hypothetical protein [Paraliomyxa miuraensis]|uniref:hypothetical protein n=1 Tax=Paraliomyxa miuraensis TaxID=376150 RepID=UPI002259300F|nr:hypothetical protein [Paraliomyxa miuraensis]MCX4247257.1 hypothetical protein [Paraliomyxa miuraensis]